MKLYTKSYIPEWGRIVDMTVEKNDSLSDYVKDETVFKVILLEKGEISLKSNGSSYNIKAPSLIFSSDKDITDIENLKKGSSLVLYFKPSVVRDEFTLENLYSGKYSNTFGTTVYQDYCLVERFFKIKELNNKIFSLTLNELNKIKRLILSIEKELITQYDGFWPCRSRSYLLELLFYIQNIFDSKEDSNNTLSEEDETFSAICEYLNEHISEQISLETLIAAFNINRNKLNKIFINKTSKTCLNYLSDLRTDMAKMILSNTEIPIGEVSSRVGYPDSNYFTKIFKKYTGFTPSEYRKNNITCR